MRFVQIARWFSSGTIYRPILNLSGINSLKSCKSIDDVQKWMVDEAAEIINDKKSM